jgi:uncharacterized RDD family membrane protein YckC
MRCPKCHYLSFDPDPRCRNCGYDLEIESPDADDSDEVKADALDLKIAPAVAQATAAPDLPLRSVEAPAAKPVTLELVRPAPPPARTPEPVRAEPALALVGVATGPAPAPARRSAARATSSSANPTTELPLFVKTMGPQELSPFAGLAGTSDDEMTDVEVADAGGIDLDVEGVLDDREPVRVPPAQRPLSVRRPVAEQPRPAPQRRPGPLDDDLLEDLQRLEREEGFRPRRRQAPLVQSGATDSGSDFEPMDSDCEVPMAHRAGAAALDGLLLGGIGAFVLWATLRVADVTPSALGVAALIPMAVFLAGVSVAYLLMFTAASGQTVGKMLMGIRVVGEGNDDDRVTIGQAASRAVLAPLSVLALGLGWLPALIGRGPVLHDRLSHTRVVRA